MTHIKHKVVTRAARTATKIGGFVDKTVNRTYRRRVRQDVQQLRTNIEFDVNYNPRRGERWTDWDTL
jgi:hypothetical protein